MSYSDSRARTRRVTGFIYSLKESADFRPGGFIILALFLLFFFTGAAQKASFADFKFAVAGDSRGYEDGINEPIFRRVLSGAVASGARFLVVVGDMITGSRDEYEHRERLLRWRSIAEEYDIPVYVVVGNHEIEEGDSEEFIREIFDMPLNGPPSVKELVYYFDYYNTRFIVLDTDRYRNFHRVDNSQMRWLEDTLRDRPGNLVFVFGHEPAFPVSAHIKSSLDRYRTSRDRLWDIFKKGAVSAYFCGHEHLFNASRHEGVYQIITGGSGAPLHKYNGKKGFYHYLIVEVKEDGMAVIRVKNLENDTIKEIRLRTGDAEYSPPLS